MKYMGSKRRIAKKLLEAILPYKRESQCWVEPFVGGANMIENVQGCRRIGGDSNEYVIAMFQALQRGWIPPDECSEEEYKEIRKNKSDYPACLVGFVGVGCAFGADFFHGYARSARNQNHCLSSKNGLMKQKEKILDVEFINSDYKDLLIPQKSLIYCDPPYKNTKKYSFCAKFNHEEFWQWCRDKAKEGHTIFISEHNAPQDFACILEIEIKQNIDARIATKTRVEKLFTLQ